MRSFMKLSIGVVTVTLLLVLGFGRHRAHAQSDEGSEEEYRNITAQAVEEFDLGNWEEARALFEQAHQIQPNARTLRGIGMASFEARRYVEAISALRRSLEDPRKPLTAEQRAQVEKLLERAKRYVGYFELHIEPEGASVIVDGREATVVHDRLLLRAGRREIVVKADGYRTLTRQVDVDGGKTGMLELVLELVLKPEPDEATKKEEEEKKEEEGGAGPGPLPWIVISASGAVAVTGAVLFVLGLNDVSTVENAETGTAWADIKDAHDRAPTFTTVGGILFGAGAAGAALGIVLLSSGGWEESEQVEVTVIPGGIQLRGAL
jgi:tetratricopeptide (TPR) repeat protein